jgi:hypothetical protein
MTKKSSRPVWLGPPIPPDHNLVTRDMSCQGIIGMSLYDTLQSLQNDFTRGEKSSVVNSEDNVSTTDTNKSSFRSSIFQDQRSIDKIMKIFADSVARSHETMSSSASTISKSDNKPVPFAPSAVLCGKVDHYNRRSDKWRFLVRNVKLVERKHFDMTHLHSRVRQKPMFWNVATSMATGSAAPDSNEKNTKSVLSLNGDLEVLAYNDRQAAR